MVDRLLHVAGPDVERAAAGVEADEAAILAEVTEIQARLARLETLLQPRGSTWPR